MQTNRSIEFFDRQFRHQIENADFQLNPFEQLALPHLSGTLLDFGCGLGNLAVAAARSGCKVVALDASPAAVARIRDVAAREALEVTAEIADLATYPLVGRYDSIASIGLLMFFDCAVAWRRLEEIQRCLRPGGIAALNVLVDGTTYLDMFAPDSHCLFAPTEFLARFEDWEVLVDARHTFPAPGDTLKRFMTVVARKPARRPRAAGRRLPLHRLRPGG